MSESDFSDDLSEQLGGVAIGKEYAEYWPSNVFEDIFQKLGSVDTYDLEVVKVTRDKKQIHEIHDRVIDNNRMMSLYQRLEGKGAIYMFYGSCTCEGETKKIPLYIGKAQDVKRRFSTKQMESKSSHQVYKALRGSLALKHLLNNKWDLQLQVCYIPYMWVEFAAVNISKCFDFLINQHSSDTGENRLKKDTKMTELIEAASSIQAATSEEEIEEKKAEVK